jgi:hypothetical protein
MHPTIKKLFLFMPLSALFMVTSISGTSTLWPSSGYFTAPLKSTAIQFQTLKGSNRIAEFTKLHQQIFSQQLISKNIYSNDLIKILGSPNEIDGNNNYIYHLGYQNEKVIFTLNKHKQVITCTSNFTSLERIEVDLKTPSKF